jgi:HEPN domain-containing protein
MRPEVAAAQRWLVYAESDLSLAAVGRGEKVLLEALCFHAQQAAEKALKALLVGRGVDPPLTHNLQSVIELLPAEFAPPAVAAAADLLSPYAVASRYPGDDEPVTLDERAEAVEAGRRVLEWVKTVLGEPSQE